VRRLTELRSKYPILHRSRFLTGEYNPELDVKDVTWINANGNEMQGEDWADTNTRCFGMLMDGRAQVTGIRQRGHDATLLMVLNAYHDLVRFTIPSHQAVIVDASDRYELRRRRSRRRVQDGEQYDVTARSLLCSC
jgi:glycogen operon protein